MKVAICFPRYGDTKGEFTTSLARMLVHSLSAEIPGRPGERLQIEIFSIASTDLVENRTILLRRAMEWQARYLLWLDVDHSFPRDALLRLMSHRLEAVGCNYLRRHEPFRPVAARTREDGQWEHVWTTEDAARRGLVEEVSHVGLGLCLIDMLALLKVREHVEKGVGWANWGPFDRKLLPGTNMRMGEDASFFAELRAAGVPVHVDHRLSWQVGHIGDRVLTHKLAQAEAEADIAARTRT